MWHSFPVTGFPRKVLTELMGFAKGQRVKMGLLKGALMESSSVKLRCLQDALAVACYLSPKGCSVLTI